MSTANYLYNDTDQMNLRRKLRRNQTEAERVLWKYLRNQQLDGMRFLRQYGVGPYILDFYCPQARLAVELDGGQHAEDQQQIYDDIRTKFLREQNIRVIRFWNNDVMKNIEGVVERIREEITPPHLPLS